MLLSWREPDRKQNKMKMNSKKITTTQWKEKKKKWKKKQTKKRIHYDGEMRRNEMWIRKNCLVCRMKWLFNKLPDIVLLNVHMSALHSHSIHKLCIYRDICVRIHVKLFHFFFFFWIQENAYSQLIWFVLWILLYTLYVWIIIYNNHLCYCWLWAVYGPF